MMPKRTRQHQIEDLSKTAFEAALPDEWVYRKLDSDYGIDGQVEIFDKQGKATGLTFNVQLKATDNKKLSSSLKCSLKKSTCGYYAHHDLPTLMVRYHVPSNSIYSRWFHQCSKININKDQKNFTFHWEKNDKWSFESSDNLYSYVEKFRKLRFPGLHFPLGVVFETGKKINENITEALKLKCKSTPYNNYVKVLNKEDSFQWLIKVYVGTEISKVELGGLSLRSFQHLVVDKSLNVDKFLNDIFVLIGISLCRIGHVQIGATVIAALVLESGFIERIEKSDASILGESAKWLAYNNDVVQVLALAKKMSLKESSYYEGVMASLLIISKSKTVSDKDFNELLEFMNEKINDSIEEKNMHGAATTHYSLGNMLHSRGRNKEAFHHYSLASKLQPKYKTKDYFIRELAGLLFENKRFYCSSKAYQTYYSLSGKNEEYCHELLADAYMFSGKYEEALNEFDKFFKKKKSCLSIAGNHGWKLKEMLCHGLVHDHGCKKQKRMPKKAMMLASKRFENPDNQQEYLLELLETDYLGGLTWFNLGATYLEMKKEKDARDAFLTAALCQRNDLEAWANAFLLTFNLMTGENVEEESLFFQSILLAANKIFGSDFMGQVLEKLPEEAPASKLIDVCQKVCSNFSKNESLEDHKMKLRFFDPNE